MSGDNSTVQQTVRRNHRGPCRVKATHRTISSVLAKITEAFLPSDLVARMREGREWKRLISSLEPKLFDDLAEAPADVKRHLFKQHISLVENRSSS
jgi:hypothetical protein